MVELNSLNGYKLPLAAILFVLTLLTSLGAGYIHSVETRFEEQIAFERDWNRERYEAIMNELKYIRNRLDSKP